MSTSGPAPFLASRTKAISFAFALPHWSPAELDGCEPFTSKAAGQFAGLLRRVAEEDGAIRAEFGLIGTAEQFVGRAIARFTGNVPQREIDAGHGVRAHADATVVVGCFEHAGTAYVDG